MKRCALFLIVAVLAGCSASPREKAVKRLRASDVLALRREAAVLYKNLFASANPAVISLKVSACPESFRRFEPLNVSAYPDGFGLGLEQRAGVESGLYVVPVGMEIVPASKGRAHFEPLAEGIFWYSFEP